MSMITIVKRVLFFIIITLIHYNCTAQKSKESEGIQKEQGKVLIPFLPGDCHQCNDGFYKNLKVLSAKKIEYYFVIPDRYSDDLDYIKKEYQLAGYDNHQFIFSSALFDKYRTYEQSFVLQFGADSNYKIYNKADALVSDLEQLNKVEPIDLGNYKIKKSTANITVKSKEQICFQNGLQANAFDYLDLKDKKEAIKIVFTDEQLLNNYILNFKDTSIAKNKLNEIKSITDIPNKDRFEQIEFVNDTLFASSSHTYIASMKDSILGGFFAINTYKDGVYKGSRALSNEHLPIGYTVLPEFHVHNNILYAKVVKDHIEAINPNYFLAAFELKNGVYIFKKMLHFMVPGINKNVGYQFVNLKFSGKYCMNSISNILYDLETEQSIALDIPVNEKFEFAQLINSFKGTNIVINAIDAKYPNLLITYFSKDEKGKATNIILNYNLPGENIVGKIKLPDDQANFFESDLSKFGYFLWISEKDNYNKLIYKKLF